MSLEIYTGMFSQTILYQVIDFSNFYIKEIKQFVVKKKKCKFHCFYLYSQYMCLLVITRFFITIKSCQGFVQNFAKEFHYIS